MNEVNEEVAIEGATVVAKRRLPHYWKLACAAVLAFGLVVGRSAAGNREHEDRDVWFVHATDPHIFIPDTQSQDESKKDVGVKQEELNEKALSDMLKRIGSLPEGDGPPAFLVLTGGLGLDPCEIGKSGNPSSTPTAVAQSTPRSQTEVKNGDKEKKPISPTEDCVKAVDPVKRENQIKVIARVLDKSPVQDIYLVAGNNDIARQSADDTAIKYFNDFIDEVQAKLAASKSSVRLYNLTRCYFSGENPATCFADIPNSDYRLIGFPSYSFEKKHEKAQTKQFQTFRQLLEDARQAGKKVLVVSHTPEMDDPYLLAQERYVNPTRSPTVTPTPAESASPAKKETEKRQTGNQSESAAENTQSSSVATWKVSDDLLDGWKEAVASDSVVAVLAGHLHDSHKEIYRRPYPWSSGSQTTFHKLFLAPPLAVKNQDNSPIQARGFSLIHLQPDHIASRLYWYNSETREFTHDPQPKHGFDRHGFWRCLRQCPRTIVIWLWNLENDDKALVRMAVLLIAFLTAFLTIVAIWQIPPASDPSADDKKAALSESKAGADLPFSNRFGKTVIAGLAGLVAAEVTKTLGNEKPSADTRWYYIIWFILFFFLLLLLLNLWRAVVEALRSRVAVVYYPLARTGPTDNRWSYWLVKRPLRWLASLRVPLLTFSDTFINLIQGKNQTRTAVFEKTIIEQQRNLVLVAGAIRESLNHLIEGRAREARPDDAQKLTDQLDSVRVNISVLSRDQTNVFYISWAHGSSREVFPKHSVAWASVFTGQSLWYLSDYRKAPFTYEKIVLFQESTIPDEKGPILLKDYYQARQDEDYEAFIILPLPSPRRGFGSDYVKGAIQISFRRASDLSLLWKTDAMKPTGDPPIYPTSQRYLEEWCPDEVVRATRANSTSALGELLRGFNEIIYKNYITEGQAG